MDPTLTLVRKLQQDAVSNVADPNLLYKFAERHSLILVLRIRIRDPGIRCGYKPLYPEIITSFVNLPKSFYVKSF
jgi:hypothetical protein